MEKSKKEAIEKSKKDSEKWRSKDIDEAVNAKINTLRQKDNINHNNEIEEWKSKYERKDKAFEIEKADTSARINHLHNTIDNLKQKKEQGLLPVRA